MRERGILGQFDYFLFLAALLLAFLGVLGIHNAGSSALENGIFLRQLVMSGLILGGPRQLAMSEMEMPGTTSQMVWRAGGGSLELPETTSQLATSEAGGPRQLRRAIKSPPKMEMVMSERAMRRRPPRRQQK